MKFNQNENQEYLYDLDEALDILCEVKNITKEELASFIDIENIEDVYSYAWSNNVMINDILWSEYKDASTPDHQFLVHGSRFGFQGPIRLDKSAESTDFGSGFYCGTLLSQAAMYVADEPNASVYVVEFDRSNLKCAHFELDTD